MRILPSLISAQAPVVRSTITQPDGRVVCMFAAGVALGSGTTLASGRMRKRPLVILATSGHGRVPSRRMLVGRVGDAEGTTGPRVFAWAAAESATLALTEPT